MDNSTIVTGTTPQQLTEKIIEGVKNELQLLKEHYQPKEPEKWLSRNETARLLKISHPTLHDWVNKGILKAYKMGNRTYFNQKEIEEILFNSNKSEK